MSRDLVNKYLPRGKFGRDLVWSYLALGMMGVSGVAINIIIMSFRDSVALGVFNQVFAIFVISAQFVSGGVQFSALTHVAYHVEDPESRRAITGSALAVTFVVGAVFSSLVYFGSGLVGRVMDSPAVGQALALAAPGLVVHCLNKVLLNVLNGLREMKAFSIGQSCRYLFMMAFVLVASMAGWPAHYLGATFTVAEVALLLVTVPMIKPHLTGGRRWMSGHWVARHIRFGGRGFMTGVMSVANVRVDVLMLGLMAGDAIVGVYSFASMVAEGFYNLLVVVRNNLNPVLVRLLKDKDHGSLLRGARKLQGMAYPASLAVGLLAFLLYRPLAGMILNPSDLETSWMVLGILLLGNVIYSGYMPYDMIFFQAGMPGTQTVLFALNLGCNVILNAALIPVLGLYGAALGTAVSLVFSIIFLVMMMKRCLSLEFGFPLATGKGAYQ